MSAGPARFTVNDRASPAPELRDVSCTGAGLDPAETPLTRGVPRVALRDDLVAIPTPPHANHGAARIRGRVRSAISGGPDGEEARMTGLDPAACSADVARRRGRDRDRSRGSSEAR